MIRNLHFLAKALSISLVIIAVSCKEKDAVEPEKPVQPETPKLENIPDVVFKNYLVSLYDKDGDNEISDTEAEAIEEINLSDADGTVESVEGVENFHNLRSFMAMFSSLKKLSLAGLTRLETVNCMQSYELSDIDLTGCTSLKELNVPVCSLTSLDVTTCVALETLSCGTNGIENLDLSKCTALTSLDCAGNSLENLDLHNNTKLNYLQCDGNALKALDLSANSSLTTLYCCSNSLSSLKMNGTSLEWVNCFTNPELKEIDCKNFKKLQTLWTEECSLEKIDLSGCDALEEVRLNQNAFKGNLELAGLKSLKNLDCSMLHELNSLDLSGCTAMENLSVSDGSLTSLVLDNCKGLKSINAQDTQLTALDLSDCASLENIGCNRSRLKTLNIADLAKLTDIYAEENELASLDCSGCKSLLNISVRLNPQLTSINFAGCESLHEINLGGCSIKEVDCTSAKNQILRFSGISPEKMYMDKISFSGELPYYFDVDGWGDKVEVRRDVNMIYYHCSYPEIYVDGNKKTDVEYSEFITSE